MHVGVGGGRLYLVVAGVGPRVPYVVSGGAKTWCWESLDFLSKVIEEENVRKHQTIGVKSCVVRREASSGNIPDGVVEEDCVLRHDADLPADRALRESFDVLSVEGELEDLDLGPIHIISWIFLVKKISIYLILDHILSDLSNSLAIDEDLAALDVVEAEQEADHGALSSSSRADL